MFADNKVVGIAHPNEKKSIATKQGKRSMKKHIFWLIAATVVGTIGLTYLLPDFAAAGTYKLDYPANYGCKCTHELGGLRL